MLSKKDRVLFIVESPEKAKTITRIFRDEGYPNVTVMATVGHFTRLQDGPGYYNTGIHPDEDFKLDYVIDADKKDVVAKLKEQVKLASEVYIASDPDREGEAIAWSCLKFLGIKKGKYKRVTYHAINKHDIFEGVENAREIDEDLVNAAHARACIDKGIGYRLSGIARNAVGAKSVGRVQSAALMMLVDREEEIQAFVPERYIDLYLKFIKGGSEFRAKYQGTDNKAVKRLESEEQVDSIYKDCKGKPFSVIEVSHKDRKESPKPPFSTATFQQECSSKLGLTVKQAQDSAQKLYDSGKISYHRTDDEQFGEEFSSALREFVLREYGKEYASGSVTRGKNDENAQEGHEGLHVLDLGLTPDRYAKEAPSELLAKVYRIIYCRTVACALKPAVISETRYSIGNGRHRFAMSSNELRFDGYRKVYGYKDDSDAKDAPIREAFSEGEELRDCSFDPVSKQTQPPARFKEATFVKEMKDTGIGRPSTYTSTIETIKSESRGYCKVEDRQLVPTKLGIDLVHYLRKDFPDIISIGYTREMERDLDGIASAKADYLEFLKGFFDRLEGAAKRADGASGKTCPECGKPLVRRKGRYGYFLGCSGYPSCHHIEKIK